MRYGRGTTALFIFEVFQNLLAEWASVPRFPFLESNHLFHRHREGGTKTNNIKEYIKKQLTKSYNGELNKLFEEWKASYPAEADPDSYFCEDGLVVKYKDADSGYDINEQWEKSQRKIMFIVKDCPDGWGYDARRLLIGYEGHKQTQINAADVREVKGGFFKNIARILYGLYYMTEENKGKN